VTLRAVILSGLLLAVMDGSAVAKVGNENLTLAGRIIEGGLVRGATEPGAKVTIAGRRLRVTDDGYFVFGLGRNAPAKVRLVVSPAAGAPTQISRAAHHRPARSEGHAAQIGDDADQG
jgi:hypothetical protein